MVLSAASASFFAVVRYVIDGGAVFQALDFTLFAGGNVSLCFFYRSPLCLCLIYLLIDDSLVVDCPNAVQGLSFLRCGTQQEEGGRSPKTHKPWIIIADYAKSVSGRQPL